VKSLAIKLRPNNIRASATSPGAVQGERMDRVIAARTESTGVTFEARKDEHLRNILLRHMVSVGDIANMALFLTSPAGPNIAGRAISVDGNVEYF
jgi:NAD(P)-dependent dehydrogenase (short-subunit alcohol dehydrogenase family)